MYDLASHQKCNPLTVKTENEKEYFVSLSLYDLILHLWPAVMTFNYYITTITVTQHHFLANAITRFSESYMVLHI